MWWAPSSREEMRRAQTGMRPPPTAKQPPPPRPPPPTVSPTHPDPGEVIYMEDTLEKAMEEDSMDLWIWRLALV